MGLKNVDFKTVIIYFSLFEIQVFVLYFIIIQLTIKIVAVNGYKGYMTSLIHHPLLKWLAKYFEKKLHTAYVEHSFPILLANQFMWVTYSMPGVSPADGFALIYLKYFLLWSSADICKKARRDEKSICSLGTR